MSESSLKLFGLVPINRGAKGQPALIPEYGVVVSPLAVYDLRNIRAWLKKNGVGDAERNSAFWQDWQTIRQMSDFEMRVDQLLHYFSTYGLEMWGIDAVKEGYVYVPASIFHQNHSTALKVITAVEPQELIDRCFAMLNSGMALSQDTVMDIINVLSECGYVITGDEEIANREAEVYFYDLSGKLPRQSTKLFRYLIFYFTAGQTMVIKDKKTLETIEALARPMPALDEGHLIVLAESFNRYKDLWMAIKSANKKNRPIVNRITKLSKVHHKPMKQNVLNSLTSRIYSVYEVQLAAENATIFQLVRVVNALRLRDAEPAGMVYRIRNSRIWTTLTPPKPTGGQVKKYEEILINEIQRRLLDVKVYIPNGVDYSIPTSEKSFVGNVPEGTILRFPKNGEVLLVGIHWDNEDTDLDLRAESSDVSIGWNTSFRTRSRGIMHSGDMTRAPHPHGASEWLYFQDLDATYNVKVNIFRAGRGYDSTMKFMIGRSKTTDVKNNHRMSPDDVLVSYTVHLDEKETYLGMVFADRNALCLYMGTATSGRGRVGRFNKYDDIQQDYAKLKIATALRLSDIVQTVTDPKDATVDLSLEKLSKDSFLALFK